MTRFLHSSSFQKQFSVCPQAGYLYQAGAPKGPTPPHFLFGQTAHLVMQLYVDHCIANRRRTDVTMVGEFIDRAVRKTGMPLDRYDELTAVIRGYLAVYEIDVEHSLEREGGIALTGDLSIVPWNEEFDYERMRNPMEIAARGIMLRGRLDETLLYPDEKRLLVRDFKSDLWLPSQSSIDDPSSRFNQQARKYAWIAWRAIYRADVVEVEFPFMRYTRFGKAATRRLVFMKDDILEIEEQELAKIRFIEETPEFPARPGDHCASCVYRETSCPIPAETLTDDPASLARRVLFNRVVNEELMDRLKEHVALYGWSGEIANLRSRFEQGEEQVPDMEKVWHELRDVGFERPWAVMSFSKTAAEKVIDKDVLQRILQSAYDPQITVRFNLHQKKDQLVELANARGIPTQIRGKNGLKDKTVLQLAWDLAQTAGGEGAAVDLPEPAAPLHAPPVTSSRTTVDLEQLEEIH